MTNKLRTLIILHLFLHFLSLECHDDYKTFVPLDFLDFCCKSFNVLRENGKDNILYHLAKGLGTPREDGTGPRLPIHRMQFGLLNYNIRYFSSETVNKLKADSDYIQWEATMYANFGHKWVCLQQGPGFAYDEADLSNVEHDGSNEQPTVDNSYGLLQQAWAESGMDVFVDCPPTVSTNPESTCTTAGSTGSDCFDVTSNSGCSIPGPTDSEFEILHVPNFTKPALDPSNNIVSTDPGFEFIHAMPDSTEPTSNSVDFTPDHSNLRDDYTIQELNHIPTSSDNCISDVTGSTSEHTADAGNAIGRNHSFLSAQLTPDEREEVCLGYNPTIIEQLHGVRPQGCKSRVKEVNSMKAKVNVAGHSLRTIQRQIQSQSYTRTAEIQVPVMLLYSVIIWL